MADVVKLGLLGTGTVGGGVMMVLDKNREEIARRTGCPVEIKTVLVHSLDNINEDVKDFPVTFTDKIEDILDDPEIDIVVELIGREHPAKEYIAMALEKGKNVITANKDVLAKYGGELFELADKSHVDFQFEAAVAGGIPIIRPMKSCLAANKINSVMGIVNGTTNYMLTRMDEGGISYDEALAEAQAKGYAESDPTADVGGLDAARKIAILASIAFNTRISLDDVYVEGIGNIEDLDVGYADDLGYVIKLLGIAKNDEKYGISANVYPVMLPKAHPLAGVNGVYNAVFVNGDAVGDAMFMGQGAGRLPTASAVCGDIIDTARNINSGATDRIGCTCFEEKKMCPPDKEMTPCYIRMHVEDKPGVLSAIAATFGAQGMSLSTVIQKNRPAEGIAEIVIITGNVSKLSLELSISTLNVLPIVKKVCSILRVEDPSLLV